MKLIGIGCSFTEGSGLTLDSNRSYEFNCSYREENCWLGQLAKLLNATAVNLGSPGGSNFYIAQRFGEYINYEYPKESQPVVICVGWTEIARTSWWDEDRNGWFHSINNWEDSFRHTGSLKEWLAYGQGSKFTGNQAITDNAKLFVNSVCGVKNIPLLQFNALGVHHTNHSFENYYLPSQDTRDFLAETCFIENDGHPNEKGHLDIANRLYNLAKERIIL